MDSNLIIEDDYVERIGRICEARGVGINNMLDKYINILYEIRAEAICEGETADALVEYIKCVEKMKGQIDVISADIRTGCNSFIEDIDKADTFLF